MCILDVCCNEGLPAHEEKYNSVDTSARSLLGNEKSMEGSRILVSRAGFIQNRRISVCVSPRFNAIDDV